MFANMDEELESDDDEVLFDGNDEDTDKDSEEEEEEEEEVEEVLD